MFSLFAKTNEAKTKFTDPVNPDDNYQVTTFDGRTYTVPGAWLKQDDERIVYNGKYYYVDWDSVEAIIPM